MWRVCLAHVSPAAADAPAVTILLTSDVQGPMPGGFFVLHTTYGRVGTTGVVGTENIGYE